MGALDTLPLPEEPLPIRFGSLMDFPDDPIACMRSLQQEFGDLAVLEDNGQRIAFVFSPALNRRVLSDPATFHSRFFAVRGGRRSAQRRVTSGLLSVNGAEHRDTRRVMMDVFAKKVLPQYHETIVGMASDLVSGWTLGERHDLNDEMVHFMVRMTGALLFGITDGEYSEELGSRIDQWVRQNHRVGMGALVASEEYTGQYEQLLSMAEELEVSIQEMFARHRSAGDAHARPDVLSLMFRAQGTERQMSDEKLVGHATLTFAAAHLTTAHTLSWTLFLLAQHPSVARRLQQELSACSSSDTPSFAELQSCTYLEWVIKESMRVLPASSYSQRVSMEPVKLGPLNLPAGTPVIFSQFMTHHRSDIFEDHARFRPERWESAQPSAYEFLPFGAGSRMCIGASLAMVELRTILAVVLKKWQFQMEAGSTVDGRVIATMLGPTSTVESRLIGPDSVAETVPVYGSIHALVDLPDGAQPSSVSRAA